MSLNQLQQTACDSINTMPKLCSIIISGPILNSKCMHTNLTNSLKLAHRDARQSTNVLFVTNWFRRLIAHASQAPLLQEALDSTIQKYSHPWSDHPEFIQWCKDKYGADWVYDPLLEHTSELLQEIRETNPVLAQELQLLWAGDPNTNTVVSSYRNRVRELARICGETMDHTPGSLDMQIVERADKNDGFQILKFMREATCLLDKSEGTSDFVDQDKELRKIKYQFMPAGVYTYVSAYRRQLNLFKEMRLPFTLPEAYNCQRMISHLSMQCEEFRRCVREFQDGVRDSKITYTYRNVIARFNQCEKRYRLGPKNRGTPIPLQQLSPTTKAMLASTQPAPDPQPKKIPDNSHEKCDLHPNGNHLKKDCYIHRKRREFVHPDTGKVGLTQAEICPKHPKSWHPPDLCGDPRFVKKRPKKQRTNLAKLAELLKSQTSRIDELQSKFQAAASAPTPTAPPAVPQQIPAQANLAAMHLHQMYAQPNYMQLVPPQLHAPAAYMARQPAAAAATQQTPPQQTQKRELQIDANGALYHIDTHNRQTRL